MFKRRLTVLRKLKNLTQIELAKILGISRGALSMYEIGQREPDFATLRKIADFFNISTDYLLGRTNEMTYPKHMVINFPYTEIIDEWEKEGKTPEEIKEIWRKIIDTTSRHKLK